MCYFNGGRLCKKNVVCQECHDASEKNVDEDGNYIEPRYLILNSHKKYIFKCNKSDHEFEVRLDNIVKNNSWCSYPCYCRCPGKLCNDLICDTCFKASFASHPKSNYLSPENNINPRYILKFTHDKYIFICPRKKHEFKASIQHISNNS